MRWVLCLGLLVAGAEAVSQKYQPTKEQIKLFERLVSETTFDGHLRNMLTATFHNMTTGFDIDDLDIDSTDSSGKQTDGSLEGLFVDPKGIELEPVHLIDVELVTMKDYVIDAEILMFVPRIRIHIQSLASKFESWRALTTAYLIVYVPIEATITLTAPPHHCIVVEKQVNAGPVIWTYLSLNVTCPDFTTSLTVGHAPRTTMYDRKLFELSISDEYFTSVRLVNFAKAVRRMIAQVVADNMADGLTVAVQKAQYLCQIF